MPSDILDKKNLDKESSKCIIVKNNKPGPGFEFPKKKETKKF